MNLARILSVTIKEILQMSRDKKLYPLLFLAPTIQIVILGYAATFDIHNIPTAVLDRSQSQLSRQYLRSFYHNGYFDIKYRVSDRNQIYYLLDKGKVKLGIEIPTDFEKILKKEEMKIMLDLDGVVWDIMHIFVEIYNEQFNENVKYEDISGWWFFDFEKWKVVYPLTLPRIMEYPVLDNYVDTYISQLNMNHEVIILTAEANTKEVLKKKLESLHIYEDTHYRGIITVDPNENKLNYEADVYIDDNPNMAEKMHEYPDKYLLLYSQNWNQEFEDEKSKNVWRVWGWDEIMLAIELIEKKKRVD